MREIIKMNFRITIKDITDEDTKLIWKNFEKI
jgi:hypothetical protein